VEGMAGPLEGHTAAVNAVLFSPDGALILSASGDRTIRMWDARNEGRHVRILEGHLGPVQSIAFSPDGARMVSGSRDRAIRIWDMHPRDSDDGNASEDWRLRDDGWMVDHDEKPLLWVPADLRTGLLWPRNTAVIHTQGSLQLDFTGRAMGHRWGECYL
jgi:WD40 repeat protein